MLHFILSAVAVYVVFSVAIMGIGGFLRLAKPPEDAVLRVYTITGLAQSLVDQIRRRAV